MNKYFQAPDGGRVEIDKIKLVGKIQTALVSKLYFFQVFTFEDAAYTATYDTYFEAKAVREVLIGLSKWQSWETER